MFSEKSHATAYNLQVEKTLLHFHEKQLLKKSNSIRFDIPERSLAKKKKKNGGHTKRRQKAIVNIYGLICRQSSRLHHSPCFFGSAQSGQKYHSSSFK